MGKVIDWLLGRDDTEHRHLAGASVADVGTSAGYLPVVGSTGHAYYRRVSAVFRARRATIATLGMLDLKYAGPRVRGLPTLARRPDPDQTRQAFVRESVASMVDNGNVFWRIIRTPDGAISSLQVTDPLDWAVTWDATRTRREYAWRLRPMRNGVDFVTIAMGRGAADLIGLGPMQHARLRGVLAALDYSQNYFLEAAEPSGILTHDAELDDTEADRLRTKWLEQHSPGTRTPAVLSGGLKWEASGLSPADSEWVATHGAGILDVAQIFGMPARILGYSQPGSSLTYGNMTDVYLSWWRETLQPEYAAPIEEALSGLMAPADAVTFDPSEFLRGDIAKRYEILNGLVRAGFDPVESASALGLPSLTHSGRLPVTVQADQTQPQEATPDGIG